MNEYCGFVKQRIEKTEPMDAVTLDAIKITPDMHPKAVFPYTHRDTSMESSSRKFFTYIYATESLKKIVDIAQTSGCEPRFPDTRYVIDENTIRRLMMYHEALTKFPDMTYEKLGLFPSVECGETSAEVLKIITDFFTKPHTPEIVDMFRFFTSFEDVIKYLNGGVLFDRESARAKVTERPLNTIILRNSSMNVHNISEEQFFAATVKKNVEGDNQYHWLYCHRKGYGIFQAGNYVAQSYLGTNFVEDAINLYYPCIGDLILDLIATGHKIYNQHEYDAFVGYGM